MRRTMDSNRFWMDKIRLILHFKFVDTTASHAIKPIFEMVKDKIGNLDCECKDIWLLEDGKPVST